MPFEVPIDEVRRRFAQFDVIAALTPSEQKAAFRVRDTKGVDYCLKIISPDYEVVRLQRELRALRAIDHPNIAHFIKYSLTVTADEEVQYILEEFIDGTDLADHLGPENVWPVERAAPFFAQLCDALAVIGELNIVHRDLKPSNIRVKDDGTPVVIDFGLARHLDLPSLTATEIGAWVGTPKYFSPEQFAGSRSDIDHRTDLFALGILLYQAIVGIHPFWRTGLSMDELCHEVCNSDSCFEYEGFAALPRTWQTLLRRMLRKERIQRPIDASLLGKLLRSAGEVE